MLKLTNIHPSDTSLYPNGMGQFSIPSAGDNSKLLMYNETPLNIDLDFLDGRTDTLHAWEANWWPIDSNTTEIDWQIDIDSLSVTTPPINAIFLTLLYPNEPIRGTYPISLVRTVGGNVTTQQSQTLDNTGNASGSNVVTIGSTAAPGNTVTLTNDGLLDLLVTIAGALVQVLRTYEPSPGGTILQEGANTYLTEQLGNLKVDGTLESVGSLTADGILVAKGAITLAAASILTHILGTLTVDQAATLSSTLNVTGLTTLGDISVNGSTSDQIINAPSGKSVIIRNNNTNILTIDGANVGLGGAFGFALNSNGVYRFRNGNTTQAWGNFSGTGSGTYNHGFGSAPFAVIPIVDVSGSATQGYDTITSTQVHITLGASLGFRATMWS